MIKEKILEQLKTIEKEKDIKILFAIETGSRAWGFESKDSDYDVRGIYIQDYLKVNSIEEQWNQVILTSKYNLDIELWDLRKFLRLLISSNPSVWEWLSSDIIYKDNEIIRNLKSLFEKDYNKEKLMKHYTSMAKQNFYKYINGVGDKANLKKYIYVLRSIGCILWIEKYNTPPPKYYKDVIELLPRNVLEFADKIIKNKRKSEKMEGSRNLEVENYIVSFFDKKIAKDKDKFDIDFINRIFKMILDLGDYE